MTWFKIIKDFKFLPEVSSTGQYSPNSGAYANLSAIDTEGKTEEELIDKISSTLQHEHTHEAFDKLYSGTLLEDITALSRETNAFIMGTADVTDPEKFFGDMRTIVGRISGAFILDELMAGRHQAGGTRLLFERYKDQIEGKFNDIFLESARNIIGVAIREQAPLTHRRLTHARLQRLEILVDGVEELFSLQVDHLISLLAAQEAESTDDNFYVRVFRILRDGLV